MDGQRAAAGGNDMPATIAEAAALLRRGEVSSRELTQACLDTIARVDPLIEACVTVMAEAAMAQARAADETRNAEDADLGPLFGIPLGIKDLYQTRGVRTTAGSAVLADWVPEEDAAAVTRLAEAGAIALCKTNTHEFAYGTVTPPTRNPWDLERTPGGSSGGSAVAVATGECLGALGTDTGGSIRIPAAACGVTGLKPTFGLVSRHGIVPLSWSLDHAGPIARTAEDCALLLDAIAGYDPRDPDSVLREPRDYASAVAGVRAPEDAVRGLRIGVPREYFFRSIDSEVESAVRAAIGVFEDLGASVEEVSMPANIDEMIGVYRAVQRPEAYTFHKDQGWLDTRGELYRPDIRNSIRSGEAYTASDYIHGQQERRRFSTELRALLERVDVLMTPALPVPPRKIAEVDTPLLFAGREEPAGATLRYTFPFNLTGQPALALPCGFTSSRLPIGLQIVAPHWQEVALLRLGHAYQLATDWHMRRPPLAPA